MWQKRYEREPKMKKRRILSAVLAAVMLISAAACGSYNSMQGGVAAASSSSEKYASWLSDRLGDDDTTDIIVGTSDDASALGIDVSDLRDEGYTIRKSDGSAVIIGKTADGLDRAVRYYANNLADTDSASYTHGEGYPVKALTIAGNDIAGYTIILPEASDASHEFAASELQKYINQACGATLPIASYGTEAEHEIRLERVMQDSADYAEFGDESYLICVDDDGTLTIKGGYYRGVMYGVYGLLQDHVGYRFLYDFYNYQSYSADYSQGMIDYVYEADAIDIPADLHDMQVPALAYRDDYCPPFSGNAGHPDYVAKQRSNHASWYMSAPRYNNYGIFERACHGVDRIIGGYPDYDMNSHVQPCYSDEDFIEYSIEAYKNIIKSRVSAGGVIGRDITTIDVAQRDYGNFCQCRKCLAQNRIDGGYVGSVLTYTNKMAEAIEEEFGDGIRIAMLSYWGTTSVPKVTRPRDNVMISYCFYNDLSKNACYSHSIDGKSCTDTRKTSFNGIPVSNVRYAAELEGWCEIMGKDKIIIWYYPGDWSLEAMNSPLLTHLRDDMAYLASFEQVYGVFQCPWSYSTEEFVIPYLLGRLMWNPNITDAEYWDMIEEYYEIMLGRESAGYVMEHIRGVEDNALDCCWTAMAWTDPSERMDVPKVIDSFPYFIELYDRAIAAAETETAERYVTEMSCSMLFTGLVYVQDPWYVCGDDDSRARYAELFEELRERGERTHFPMAESRLSGGMKYDIDTNLAYLFGGSNRATDGPAEWWLLYPRQQEIAATAEVTAETK